MAKTDLSAAERRALQELAQRGSPVDLSMAEMELGCQDVEIEQAGCFHDSKLFELEDGRIAFMADIVLTNQTSRTMYGIDIELRTSFSDWEWLTPLVFRAPAGRGYSAYKFPGKCGLQLEHDLVINHQLFDKRTLPSRRPLEGFLLAIGGRMPTELCYGQTIEVNLAVIGSDHAEYEKKLILWTERLDPRPRMRKPDADQVARAKSVFAYQRPRIAVSPHRHAVSERSQNLNPGTNLNERKEATPTE